MSIQAERHAMTLVERAGGALGGPANRYEHSALVPSIFAWGPFAQVCSTLSVLWVAEADKFDAKQGDF